jgi:predicted DNA-binding antitoxin AbrB/MazE fold protein
MSKLLDATYENGVFKLSDKIEMSENQKVKLKVLPGDYDWEEEFDRIVERIHAKMQKYTSEEIEEDIRLAVEEVRNQKQ